MLCLNSASLPLYVLQMKHISRNMARDTHNTRFYTLSSFCKSAISLKGLGKLGLLINEAPRQVSDLLEPTVPLSRALVSSLQSRDREGGKEREPIQAWNCHQIFEKTVLEAPASSALKVCARNVVGEAGSLCQKVPMRQKRPILSSGGVERQCYVPFWATQPPPVSWSWQWVLMGTPASPPGALTLVSSA